MTDTKSPDVWYVSKNQRNGFTQMVDEAETDRFGHPVICPGHIRRVWNAVYARQKSQRDAIWDMALDVMEELVEAEENFKKESQHVLKIRHWKRQCQTLSAKRDGLLLAVAELELPEGRSQSRDEDLAWALKRANWKYEQESE